MHKKYSKSESSNDSSCIFINRESPICVKSHSTREITPLCEKNLNDFANTLHLKSRLTVSEPIQFIN